MSREQQIKDLKIELFDMMRAAAELQKQCAQKQNDLIALEQNDTKQ